MYMNIQLKLSHLWCHATQQCLKCRSD